jgi:hypothetical protein
MLKDRKPFPEYVGICRISRGFLGRVLAFKYDRSGKVYGVFVKYSPLVRGLMTVEVIYLSNLEQSIGKLLC